MKISVIIPLYNKEQAIKNTVLSVINQRHKDFELLIVDDGSTDNSLKVISEIKDERISILSKKNGGVSDARNFGIKNANHDYIFLLDADDIIYPNCFEEYAELVKNHPNYPVYTSNFSVSPSNQKAIVVCRKESEGAIKNPLRYFWERKIFPRMGSMLLKKVCFEEVGYFVSGINSGEDFEFVIRVLNRYPVVYTPKVLFSYQSDFSALSKTLLPIEQDFSYWITTSKKSFFERLILVNMVYHSLLTRFDHKDWPNSKLLSKNLLKHSQFFLLSFIYRKFFNLLYKIRSQLQSSSPHTNHHYQPTKNKFVRSKVV
jgi:glycosyltransferase involved in cell wall biosynthesis